MLWSDFLSTWGDCRDAVVNRSRNRKRKPTLNPLLAFPGRCSRELTGVRYHLYRGDRYFVFKKWEFQLEFLSLFNCSRFAFSDFLFSIPVDDFLVLGDGSKFGSTYFFSWVMNFKNSHIKETGELLNLGTAWQSITTV